MITWLKVLAGNIACRYSIIKGTIRLIGSKAQRIREFRNVNSLLMELHSDTALQLPLLVEQNRKMFREIESLRIEIERLKQIVEARKNA